MLVSTCIESRYVSCSGSVLKLDMMITAELIMLIIQREQPHGKDLFHCLQGRFSMFYFKVFFSLEYDQYHVEVGFIQIRQFMVFIR